MSGAEEEPPPEREGRSDLKASTVLLALLGGFQALGMIGLMLNRETPAGLRAGIVSVLAIALLIGFAMLRRRESPSAAAGKAVLGVLRILGILTLVAGAAVVGLVILLFVVCASGGMRFH